MKAIIVDDNVMVCERVRNMLKRIHGVDIVGEAHNVPEAISSIATLKPDIVILDLQLPGGTGLDVLKSAKKYSPTPLVIILTNYPYPQYRKRCLDEGADYFFDKSIEFDKVAEVFDQLHVATILDRSLAVDA